MEQLGSLDSAFVYLESEKTPLHMGGVMIYDPSTAPGGRVTYQQIMNNLSGRVASARVLRRRLARVPLELDRPYWVEDKPVDMHHHVSHLALPEPADWREFCQQVARFLERRMDMNRPLWEMLLIEGLHNVDGLPPNAFALVMKMHHSTMDGIAGMEMLGAIHDQESSPPPRTKSPDEPFESPSKVDMVVRAMPGAVRHPWRILKVVAGLGPSVVPMLARRALANDAPADAVPAQRTPVTRFNTTVGPRRTVGGVRLELAEIKTIKKSIPGATVNDVVLALIGGALRHYLDDVDELPAESLTAVMPISLRAAGGADSSGNQMTAITISVRSDIADPLERVRLIHNAASAKKSIREGEGVKRIAEIADAIPAGLMGLAGRLMSQVDISHRVALFNLGVSNVPGPGVPIYMTGAKAVDIYGLAVSPNGLRFAIMLISYCGSLTIGFQCGAEMIPDPERYEECLRHSFAELVEAAAAG
jgi:diacylglycerol O-acyltransferase